MRFACIIHEYQPFGGLQRDMRGIVEQLLQRGHHVEVFTMRWQGAAIDGAAYEHFPPCGLTHPQRQRRFYRQLQVRLAGEQFHCIVGFNRMPGLDVLFNGDDCFAWKLQQRSFIHRYLPRARHYLAMERAAWANSTTQQLLVSARQQQQYLACYPSAAPRMHLLPPGVTQSPANETIRAAQTSRLRAELKVAREELLLLFVASHFRTKGLDLALRSLPGLDTPWRLLVVGGDEARPFARLAARLGIDKRVAFLGARDDVAELMQAADLLLHPARNEAAGLVLLEALQAGLAVITSSVCGHAQHISDADAGLILEPSRVTELLPSALATLKDRQQLRRWQQNALHYAQQHSLSGLHERAAALLEQWAGERCS